MRYLLVWICFCLISTSAWGQTAAQLLARARQEPNLRVQIDLLSQAIEKNPKYVDAYHYRADAYQALGDTRQAIQDYNRVVALRPKDPFRYYARGLAYSHMKETQLAISDLTKAIHLKPSYKAFYLARAREYRAGNKYALALADYTAYAGDWSKASEALLKEVIPVSLAAYRYEQAQEQLDALVALGDDSAQRYVWQGKIWQRDSKIDEAISAFSKAINRGELQAYELRANALRDIGEYEAAVEDYTRVLEQQPEAYWFNRRGLVREEQKQFQEAIADYSRAIELDPKWAVAYNNRGFAYANLKEWEKAKSNFETAIRLDPSASTPYVNLAGIYWIYKKDRKRTYSNLQKALKHNFKDYDALFDEEQKGWMFKGINHTAEFRSILYN